MKRYNMNLTCKGLFKKMDRSEINFDCAVQRGYVWDNEKQSLLIHSILYGYSIPAFYMTKNENGTYDSLDGKQRSHAIYSFMNNEFSLSVDFPAIFNEDGEEENFSGMTFEQLPEWAQDTIKDYSLTVYYYEDMTEMEVHEFFRRLNNGKPLSAVELTRVKAVSILDFQQIAKHKAIASVITEKGKAKFNDENMAMQIYAMAYMPSPDFGTKAFRPWITEAVVTDEQKRSIMNGLNMVNNFLSILRDEDKSNKENARVLRKIKSRTHFVSAAYYGMICAEKGMEQEKYNEVMYDFFKTTTTSANEDYNKTVGAGSASNFAVQKRKDCMDNLAKNCN